MIGTRVLIQESTTRKFLLKLPKQKNNKLRLTQITNLLNNSPCKQVNLATCKKCIKRSRKKFKIDLVQKVTALIKLIIISTKSTGQTVFLIKTQLVKPVAAEVNQIFLILKQTDLQNSMDYWTLNQI